MPAPRLTPPLPGLRESHDAETGTATAGEQTATCRSAVSRPQCPPRFQLLNCAATEALKGACETRFRHGGGKAVAQRRRGQGFHVGDAAPAQRLENSAGGGLLIGHSEIAVHVEEEAERRREAQRRLLEIGGEFGEKELRRCRRRQLARFLVRYGIHHRVRNGHPRAAGTELKTPAPSGGRQRSPPDRPAATRRARPRSAARRGPGLGRPAEEKPPGAGGVPPKLPRNRAGSLPQEPAPGLQRAGSGDSQRGTAGQAEKALGSQCSNPRSRVPCRRLRPETERHLTRPSPRTQVPSTPGQPARPQAMGSLLQAPSGCNG